MLVFAVMLLATGWVLTTPRGQAQVCVKVQLFTTSSTVTAMGTEPCEPVPLREAKHDCFEMDERPTARVVVCWPVLITEPES